MGCTESHKIYEANVVAAMVKDKDKDIKFDYTFGKEIHKSTQLLVRMATKTSTKQKFVVKSYQVARSDREAGKKRSWLDKEIDSFKVVDHPNICRLYEAYHDRIAVHMVMSPCTGANLRDHLENTKCGEKDIAHFAHVMVSCMLYLHAQGMQHTGLRLKSFVFHTAASRLKQRNQGCDPWAVGCLTFIMLGLYHWTHVGGADESSLVDCMRAGEVPFDRLPTAKLSKRCKDFITTLVGLGITTAEFPETIREHKYIVKALAKVEPVSGKIRRKTTIVKKVKAYRNLTPLQRAGMGAVVFSLPEHKIEELRSAFHAIDKDQSGVISRAEMADYLREKGVDGNELVEIVEALDENDNGGIDYSEFLAAVVRPDVAMDYGTLRSAFERLDISDTGRITRGDVEELLGANLDDEQLKKAVSDFDADGDGSIDFEEFQRLMKHATSMT